MSGGDGFWTIKSGDADPILSRFEESGFSIEIMHIASGKACVFPAWLTSFNEMFTSQWNQQNVFGRADPIGSWSNTSRRISMSLSIPSFSVEESYANMHQYEHLVAFLYPSYETNGSSNVMNAYPLLKMKFANFVKNANIQQNAVSVLKGGLAGWIESVDFTPDLESGFHHMSPNMSPTDRKAYNRSNTEGIKGGMNKSHTFIPKVFELNLSFVVVHEHSLGWNGTSWIGGSDFPYGYDDQSGKLHDVKRGDVSDQPMNRTLRENTGVNAKETSKVDAQPKSKAKKSAKKAKTKSDKAKKARKVTGQ